MASGVFNTSRKSSLDELIIESPEENVFVGCSRELKVKGYDKNYNPVQVDIDDITWSCSGVDGKVKDGILIAGNEAGTIKIKAKKGKASAEISIDILSAPNEIDISPKKSYINKNEKIKFSITAKNKNGYYASINNDELTWEILSGDGEIKDGTFYPSKEGTNLIAVSSGNAKSYAIVQVSGTKIRDIDFISTDNYSLVTYPSEVTGNITKENNNSINMDYDFTKTTATRAAYLRFKEPIILNQNDIALYLDVTSEETISEYIKFKIIDSLGNNKLIMGKRSFDASTSAQAITISLTDISLPAKLTDIYVGQDTPDILASGTVTLSNLKIESKQDADTININPPKDIKGADSANKPSNTSGEKAFKIALYDSINTPTILLDKFKNSKLVNKINKEADLLILTSQESNKDNITIPIVTASPYNVKDYENLTLILVDVSNGGLRTTDYTQWINLQKDIKNSKNKNIIILMNGSLNNFSDEKERKLFIDNICEIRRSTSKNIWVLNKNIHTDYSMQRGIRYLSVNNSNYDKLSAIEIKENEQYILINITKDNMSYEIKNIF